MKKLLSILMVLVLILAMAVVTVGCGTEAERASYNVSQEADNFNVIRTLTVIDLMNGDILFQMTAKMSVEYEAEDQHLVIMIEDENGKYHKDIVGIAPTMTYIVDDVLGSNVSQYKFSLNYNPKMWIPVDIKTID